jgi:hypothetical protein
MIGATGYVLILSKERHQVFTDQLDLGWDFAEAVPDFKLTKKTQLLGFILNKKMLITHLAYAKRGQSAATQMRKLKIDAEIALTPPVAASSLANKVPKRLKRFAAQKFRNGGLLSPKVFSALLEVLKKLSPETGALLQRFSQERAERIAKISAESRSALGLQKVAVETALSMAGIPREEILEWDPGPESKPKSFLDGLPEVRLGEDAMLAHDLMTLPGYEILKTYHHATVVFASNKCRLTVVLANRLPLEKQTGTDLIYFNETFSCFVMVQYKAMEREQGKTVFRLPNVQLTEEIKRMRAMQSILKKYQVGAEKNAFRFSDNPFFIKLCPRIVFNPDDASLIKGMYIPLGYWDRLIADPEIMGPKGGKVISYQNVGRYLDNTEFISLVGKAWVGTTVRQSGILEKMIRATIQSGKAIAIGIKIDLAEEPPDDPEND